MKLQYSNPNHGNPVLYRVHPSLSSFRFPRILSSATCNTVTQWDPFAVVNVLFFLNVCVGFWVVGLLQRSFWLIDPYWSIIPPLIAHFYRLHSSSLSAAVPARGDLMLVMVWIWSIRLTHSYFRREEWKFGEREDWRYYKMATVDYPRSWPIMSFLLVGVCQVCYQLCSTFWRQPIFKIIHPLRKHYKLRFTIFTLLKIWTPSFFMVS